MLRAEELGTAFNRIFEIEEESEENPVAGRSENREEETGAASPKKLSAEANMQEEPAFSDFSIMLCVSAVPFFVLIAVLISIMVVA